MKNTFKWNLKKKDRLKINRRTIMKESLSRCCCTTKIEIVKSVGKMYAIWYVYVFFHLFFVFVFMLVSNVISLLFHRHRHTFSISWVLFEKYSLVSLSRSLLISPMLWCARVTLSIFPVILLHLLQLLY
jgi:lipopolysaccharide export LptBFGC system permease protein LptF